MSNYVQPRAASFAHHENAAMNGKPHAVAQPVAQGRRALGDISNSTSAAPGMGKPVAKPAILARAGAGAAVAQAPVQLHHAYAVPPPAVEDRTDVSSLSSASFADMDVDSGDVDDPAAVTEYVNDIYQFFKDTEIAKTAKYGYMGQQADINEKMRAILIDWLIEVHLKFKLMPETMYLTVNLIDRFLERKQVVRQKLQLVGVTAMLVASKYEEIYAPEVRDFVYITDKAYTKEQILMMEATMLNALDFRITVPTPFVFLNRFLKVAGEADFAAKASLLATYVVERSLQEYKMLHHAPSKIAAAGVNMALRTVRGPAAWDAKLERYTGYKQSDLADAIRDMQAVLDTQAGNNLKAVHKKYSLPKFGEIAMTPFAPL